MMLVYIALMAVGAAFVQSSVGFGFGIFIMTVLPYLLPSYGEATTLSGMLALMSSLGVVAKYRQHLRWRKLLPIMVVGITFCVMSVRLVAVLDDALLLKILGVALIAASAWFMFFSKRVRLRPTLATQGAMGTLSGFMGGMFGMQGPPAVLYFVGAAENKEEYVAMAQTYFMVSNMAMTVVRAMNGFLTTEVWHGWLVGLPAVAVGTLLGIAVFKKLSMERLRTIIYVYMALAGVLALVR